MGRSTAGRPGPGVLGRVLRAGGLAATAAAALAAMLALSAAPALASGGQFPNCGPYGCSPVLIDVDGSGFHLTGAAGGVLFDVGGRGHLVRIA